MSINNINNLQNLANSVNQVGSNSVSNNQASNDLSKSDIDWFKEDAAGSRTTISATSKFDPNTTPDQMVNAIVNPLGPLVA